MTMIRKMNVNGLVEKAQSGDEEAMNLLLAEAEGFVFDFARSHIFNAADADDIASEVLAEVWMNIKKRPKIVDFNSWLSRAMWYRINDYCRKFSNQKEIPESHIHHEEIRFSGAAQREMKEAESAYRGRL